MRLRRRAQRLAAAVSAPAALGSARRGHAALRQVPLLRRIRVRLGLGRCPRAPRRPATTPSSCRRCPSRRCAAAGSSPPARPSGAAWSPRRSSWRARAPRCTCCFPLEDEAAAHARARHAPAAHGAVSLAERGLRGLRGLPRAAQRTRGARRSARSGAASREAGVRLRWLEGAAIERRALGILQPLLPRDLCGARLEPVPQPGILHAHRFDAARESGDGAGRARGPADRFAACSSPMQERCTAATGARSSTCRCCTSNAAITSRSSSRSAAARGVRGRRAGRAQAVPRPDAGGDPVGALARPSALFARGGSVPRARRRGRARYVDELCDHSPFKA